MSRLSNKMGPSRVRLSLLMVPMFSAVSIGLDHQVSIRLSSPAVATVSRSATPSLTAIQRVRVTVRFEASGSVRASTSRVTSGAPAEYHQAEQTVKTHVRSILTKLALQDRVQAAIFALRHHGAGSCEHRP